MAVSLSASPSLGAGGGGSSDGSGNSNNISQAFVAAEAAVDAGDYEDAIEKLTRLIADEPKNADAYNYLGYSNRKLGRMDQARNWYAKALDIDPRHLGANEYLGELYVQTGEMDKAAAQLDILDGLCFFGCPEYDQLKRSIAAAKKRSGS
ncbi:MAG: tetratricopeptide repeat protein [Rhodospirillales bacterium]